MLSVADFNARIRADIEAPLSALVHCACKLRRPLNQLFVCESCSVLACDECSVAEVDSYFCANCFASITASAALQDGFRCKQCMECPQCTHVLSLIRDAAQICKFVCENCQWTSDTVGLVDPVPTGLLFKLITRERESSGREHIQKLIKVYRARENQARKARQATAALTAALAGTSGRSSLAQRASVSSLALSAAAASLGGVWDSTSSAPSSLDDIESAIERKSDALRHRLHNVTLSESQNASDELSAEFLSNPVGDSTLAQRLVHPECVSRSVSDLLPRRKQLWAKHSHRCNKCRKYLIKPSPQPRSATFEKRSLAMLSLPSISFSRPATWIGGQSQTLTLFFTNRLQSPVKLAVRIKNSDSNCDVQISDAPISVQAYDMLLAEDDLLDESDRSTFIDSDDRQVVVFRRLNKVGMSMTVTPRCSPNDVLIAALSIQCWFESGVDFAEFTYDVQLSLGKLSM